MRQSNKLYILASLVETNRRNYEYRLNSEELIANNGVFELSPDNLMLIFGKSFPHDTLTNAFHEAIIFKSWNLTSIDETNGLTKEHGVIPIANIATILLMEAVFPKPVSFLPPADPIETLLVSAFTLGHDVSRHEFNSEIEKLRFMSEQRDSIIEQYRELKKTTEES